MVCFRLSNSSITVSSFNGDYGNYQLVIREDGSILRTRIQNNYLWMEVDNWSYWKQLLMERHFIRYITIMCNHFRNILAEVWKYILGIKAFNLNQKEEKKYGKKED